VTVSEAIVKEIIDPAGQARVLIIRREDGRYTYRRQNREALDWGPQTIDAGVYDSPDTAETEARQRVAWLRKLFH
jgi:hypothetical protein